MNGSDPMPEHDNEVARLKAEIERLEHNQITASHTAIAQAAAIQAQHASASMREADAQMQRADALDAKCTQFTNALMRAMSLIDELLRENARLCAASDDPPSVRLFAAKASFDVAMHKLLGDGDQATTTADTTEVTTSLTISTEGEAK